VGQFESKFALSVQKNAGRRGLYKTMCHCAAARFLGGQRFVPCINEIAHYPSAATLYIGTAIG
jgi:hypothetical protein